MTTTSTVLNSALTIPALPGLPNDVTPPILSFCDLSSLLNLNSVNRVFFKYSDILFKECFNKEHPLLKEINIQSFCSVLKSNHPSSFWRVLCTALDFPLEKFPLKFTATFIQEGFSNAQKEYSATVQEYKKELKRVRKEIKSTRNKDRLNSLKEDEEKLVANIRLKKLKFQPDPENFNKNFPDNLNEKISILKALDCSLGDQLLLKKCFRLINETITNPSEKTDDNLNKICDLINSLKTEIKTEDPDNSTLTVNSLRSIIWEELDINKPDGNTVKKDHLPQLRTIVMRELMEIPAMIQELKGHIPI